MAWKSSAASVTVRAMGPVVSLFRRAGTTPLLRMQSSLRSLRVTLSTGSEQAAETCKSSRAQHAGQCQTAGSSASSQLPSMLSRTTRGGCVGHGARSGMRAVSVRARMRMRA